MINLERLNQDDKKLMIEFLPKHELIDFLKKNSKRFSKELSGTRLDQKSKLLQQRLPGILLKAFEQEDKIMLNFIRAILYKKLQEINKYTKVKLGVSGDIKEIIQTKQKDGYVKLLDILLEKIDKKYIFLFLNLNEIELKVRQKKLIETSIEEVAVYRKIKEQVKEEAKEKLETKFKEEIKSIEEKGQSLLKIERAENKALNYQLLEKDKIIKEMESKFNEKIRDIGKQQNSYSDLKKKLKEREVDNKKLNDELNTNQKVWQQNLEKERQKSEELQIINENQNLKIKQLENELKERYETYSKKCIEKWKEENQAILNQERCLIEKINSLNDNIKVLQNDIMDLEMEKENTQEKLEQYNDLVTNFINNIDKEIITAALKESILNIKVPSQEKQKDIQLHIKNQIKSEDIEVCESVDEWSEKIAYNLKSIGVGKSRSEWSDYIVSVLAAKMIPLIVGCKTREIAKSISCTYSGETPFIITLPGGYNEVNELIELYHKCEAKVILIEGAVGQMNESILLPLFKEHIEAEENDKLILISCEDTNMISLMPSYLLEYMAVIEITDIKPVVQHKYIYADSISALPLFKKNSLEINDSYKNLDKLLRNIEITSAYIITRTLILSYLCKIRNIENALVCLSICDLKSIFKDDDVKEKIANNIDRYKNYFTQELKNLIVGE